MAQAEGDMRGNWGTKLLVELPWVLPLPLLLVVVCSVAARPATYKATAPPRPRPGRRGGRGREQVPCHPPAASHSTSAGPADASVSE